MCDVACATALMPLHGQSNSPASLNDSLYHSVFHSRVHQELHKSHDLHCDRCNRKQYVLCCYQRLLTNTRFIASLPIMKYFVKVSQKLVQRCL